MQTLVILICTFNRSHYLDDLLTALAYEVSTAECTTLSVVIIDNGTEEVKSQVEAFRLALPIEYVRLPNSGLVGARNYSLACGLRHQPDFLAFIDDDEVPEKGWLNNLVSTLETSRADFAVGRVQPRFAEPPPGWAPPFFTKSGEAYCTSNLIIRGCLIPEDESRWFQERFTYTGGEDGDFLSRLAEGGARGTVASSAIVYENVPRDRVTLKYLWRRGLRDGVVLSMMASSRIGGGTQLVRITFPKAALKLLYGLNHLIWSLTDSDRLPRAIDDFAVATGLVIGSFNFSVDLYGHRT